MKYLKVILSILLIFIISNCDMITEDFQSDVDLLKTDLENLQTQITHLESELNEMESELKDKDSALEDLSNSLSESILALNKEIEDLSNSLDSTDSSILKEINDLTILLNDLTIQYNELLVSVSSIEESLSRTVVTLVGTVYESMYEDSDKRLLYVRSEYITQYSHVEFWFKTYNFRGNIDDQWTEASPKQGNMICDGNASSGEINVKWVYDGYAILSGPCRLGFVGDEVKVVIINDNLLAN